MKWFFFSRLFLSFTLFSFFWFEDLVNEDLYSISKPPVGFNPILLFQKWIPSLFKIQLLISRCLRKERNWPFFSLRFPCRVSFRLYMISGDLFFFYLCYGGGGSLVRKSPKWFKLLSKILKNGWGLCSVISISNIELQIVIFLHYWKIFLFLSKRKEF